MREHRMIAAPEPVHPPGKLNRFMDAMEQVLPKDYGKRGHPAVLPLTIVTLDHDLSADMHSEDR